MHIEDNRLSERALILGDPGAARRAGLKGATKVFKHGQKSPWIPILTGPFPNDQENAGSWLGTKNALYYWAQSANSFSWVLFVSSYMTAIISPQLPSSFTKLSWPETKEVPMSRKTFRMLSPGAIKFALRKLFLTDHNVSYIIGSLRWSGDEKVKNVIAWQGKTTTLHVHHAFLYISLPSLHDYHVDWKNVSSLFKRRLRVVVSCRGILNSLIFPKAWSMQAWIHLVKLVFLEKRL